MSQYVFDETKAISVDSQVFSNSVEEVYGYSLSNSYGYESNLSYGFSMYGLGVHRITLSRELQGGETVKLVYRNGKELVLSGGDNLDVFEVTGGTFDELGNKEVTSVQVIKTIGCIIGPNSHFYFCDSYGTLYKLSKNGESVYNLTNAEGAVTNFSVTENSDGTSTITINQAEKTEEKPYITFEELPDRYDYHTSRNFWDYKYRSNT